MDSFKVTLVGLLISLPVIAGLSCLKCEDLHVETDNTLVKNFVKGWGFAETPACRAPVDNKTTTLSVEECSAEGSSCFFVIATGSASLLGVSVEGTFTRRGCHTTPENKKRTCEDISLSNYIPPDLGDAEGSICYCSTDKCNGQTRLSPVLAVFFLSLVTFFSLR